MEGDDDGLADKFDYDYICSAYGRDYKSAFWPEFYYRRDDSIV